MQPIEETPTDDPRRWPEVLAVLALSLFSCWLVFADLGASSFHDGDEALYASVAREMTASGEFLTPTYCAQPLLNKPPLVYWMMSASMRWLPGTLEGQARLPSALAGLALLALVYITTRRLGGVWCALGATLLLLGNHQWLFEHCVRSANLDSVLITLMFAAIAFGARAAERRADLVLSALSCALVLMVKLPLVVFLVPTLFIHLWSRRRAAAWRWLGWTALGAAVLALPWHVYSFIVHGREFWDVYFVYEILGRTGDAVLDSEAGWWTHLTAAWRSFLPWSPLLVLALAGGLLGRPRADGGGDDNGDNGDNGDEGRATARLLGAYVLFILLFFCLIRSKWPWYALPAYPALAVLGALFVKRLTRSPWWRLAPLAVALPVLGRCLLLGLQDDYAPAARSAWRWPLHSRMYSFEFGAAGPLEWGCAALVLVLLVFALARTSRARAGRATLAIAALGLALSLFDVARVPRTYRAPTSHLMDVLASNGTDRLLLVGFWQPATYQKRLTPLTGAYFLNLPGAEVVDCYDSFECLAEGLTERTALIIKRGSFRPQVRRWLERRLPAMHPAPEVWILEPGARGGFERFIARP